MLGADAWDGARRRVRDLATTTMARLPRRVRDLAVRIADRDLVQQASSLAFFGLVSALPLLLLGLALVEAVAGEQALTTFLEQASSSGPEGSRQFLEQLAEHGGSFTFVTLVLTLWPATAYGAGLRRALLRASGEQETAPGLRGRLRAVGLVLLLPVLLLAGLPLAFVLTGLSGDGVLTTVLGWLLALAAATGLGGVATTALYRAFAPGDLGWRDTLTGALWTAVSTAVFSVAFVIYLNVAETEERFGGGTIALVVLLGVWLFVANMLLLAGYHAVLALDTRRDPSATA
ncbi:YhjD/YihY/BrkB family envelope integrity protein [Egicoccus sp. AB-alg2]|uniref:YhjD/YihY/BrkB family envelope integrity protein n=1 Tax=Egicoccus sp. AB-alg2 TaxID=3242693 RepID=UPI00359E7BE7